MPVAKSHIKKAREKAYRLCCGISRLSRPLARQRNWRFERGKSLFLTASLLLFSHLAFGQRITGDIVGNVTDTTGAVVPSAKITVRSLDTARELSVTSSSEGSYSFLQLSPGRYALRCEREGFETKVITDVVLAADQTVRVDIPLSLGAVSTTVEVSGAGAELLQTETSELAQVVDNRKIQELPMNGRSYVQLGTITPGVMGGEEVSSDGSRFTNRPNVSLWVAGQRETGTSFLVDGIETRNDSFGFVNIRPSIDSIAEFKLDRNAFGASFGGDSAAVVNVITKSGSNSFHGGVYEFLRNDALDARNFFDLERPPLRQNDFGGTLGGPVIKNKLFFFASVEAFRQRKYATLKGLFPSQAQLAGNLADDSAGTGIFPTSSPFCTANPDSAKCVDVIDPSTHQPFPGNVISSGISHFASTYAQFVPATNNLSELPFYNRIVTVAPTNDYNQFSVRIDHNLSSKDAVFYRYIYDNETQFTPGYMVLRGFDLPLKGQNFVLGWTRTITPTLVNSFHAGYNRGGYFMYNEGGGPGGKNYAKEVFGLQNTPINPYDFGLPGANILGFSNMGYATLPQGFFQQMFQFTDALSYMRGKHTLTFGGDFRRRRDFQFVDSFAAPSLGFNGLFTGSSLGDFLLGIPNSASTGVGDATQNLRFNYLGFYGADSYKVTPNLTLNFGLRWEYKGPPSEINNKQAVFDFAQAKILLACKDIRCSIFEPQYDNWAPRVGFAYVLPFGGKKTVVRGGFGTYWDLGGQVSNNWTFLVLTPPFVQTVGLTAPAGAPTIFADTLFPPLQVSGAETNGFPFTVDRYQRRPYSPQWNLSVQHEFRNDWALEVSYLGNASIRNGTFGNADPGRVDPTGQIPLQDRVPYPQFAGILLAAANGHGNYNAGTISMTKRFAQGLTLLANYTYAKSIDDSSAEINFTYRPEEGRRADRAPQTLISIIALSPATFTKFLWGKAVVTSTVAASPTMCLAVGKFQGFQPS